MAQHGLGFRLSCRLRCAPVILIAVSLRCRMVQRGLGYRFRFRIRFGCAPVILIAALLRCWMAQRSLELSIIPVG